MKLFAPFLAALLLLVAAAVASAAPAAGKTATAPEAPPAVLKIANRPVVTLRETLGPNTPAERVAAAEKRIDAFPADALLQPITVREMRVDDRAGKALHIGPHWLFVVMQGDLDPEGSETLEQAVEQVKARVAEALAAKAEQSRLPVLLKGIAYSVGATFLFLLIAVPLGRLRRRTSAKLEAAAERRLAGLTAQGVDAAPHAITAIHWTINLTVWALLLIAINAWLTFVLTRFPVTAPWGNALTDWFVDLVEGLGLGVLEAVPGLVTVVVIFLLARWLSQFLRNLFDKVTAGTVSIPGVYPETAGATRRLTVAVVWLFAFAAAYPYLPGADTNAFKGISVFVGLMLSLGSSGLVGQAMSGLVIIYSRSLSVGDLVKAGETEGVVSALGMLSTKLVTMRGEEVTVPNSVLVSGAIHNFSRLSRGKGARCSTQVTIGYDAPWRQVHAMLREAAARTPGIRAEPAPRVLQRSLADFYPEYDLVFHIENALERPQVLSTLHGNIQDVFNEYGVQIMSPNFEDQPATPVLVPKEKWYAAPASENGEEVKS